MNPAPPSAHILRLHLLGPVRLEAAGRPVPVRGRKSRALLAYLAMTDGQQETRERLLGLLWSEPVGERKAQDSLRQMVHQISRALLASGCAELVSARLSVGLAPASVTTDLREVLEQAAAGRAHPRLLDTARVTETLLQDLDDTDPYFRDWLLARRESVRQNLTRALEAAMRDGGAEAASRLLLAEALLNLDPTHEEACRAAIQLRAESGDLAGAQRAYEALCQILKEEHDIDPSPETQGVFVRARQGAFDRPAATGLDSTVQRALDHVLLVRPDPGVTAPGPRPTRPVLAVEPFQQNGIAEETRHLVQGFRHHLLASLMHFREWAVVDGTAEPSPAVTGYTIEATAYQAGDTISMMLLLREQASRRVIWSNPFRLTLEDWFTAQQRVMRGIATSLNVQVSAERLMRLDGQPDVALDIHDRWLRGQALLRPFKAENWNRAAAIFADCIRDAPNFALAYSSLAQMNTTRAMVHPGVLRDRARAEETVKLARRAVELDPLDSRAHLHFGWALAFVDRHAQAAVPMAQACELNPYDSWTLLSVALFHAYDGDLPRARFLADEALNMTLHPSPAQWGYQGTIRYLEGDFAGAVEATLRAQDVIPTLPAWRAAARAMLGDTAAARADAAAFSTAIRTRWAAEARPTDTAIGHWLLHQFPISSAPLWRLLHDGFAGAGIAVPASRQARV